MQRTQHQGTHYINLLRTPPRRSIAIFPTWAIGIFRDWNEPKKADCIHFFQVRVRTRRRNGIKPLLALTITCGQHPWIPQRCLQGDSVLTTYVDLTMKTSAQKFAEPEKKDTIVVIGTILKVFLIYHSVPWSEPADQDSIQPLSVCPLADIPSLCDHDNP